MTPSTGPRNRHAPAFGERIRHRQYLHWPDEAEDGRHALVANLQFPAIRDQLIADIPRGDEPMQQVLFVQTERPREVVTHRVDPATAPARLYPHQRRARGPVLTAIGFSN